VQIVTLDEDRQHGLARGAFGFVTKPSSREGLAEVVSRIGQFITPRRKRLLIVEDNAAERLSITELLGHEDIDIIAVETGAEALERLRSEQIDCVVLDLRLPDMSGFDVLDQLRAEASLSDIPVVVFTGRELSPEEDAQLHTMARSVVVKGVESPERLLDETALFLHRVVKELPPEKQRMLERLLQFGRGPARQDRTVGRRRRAQHLRPQLRARAARHESADGDHRQRSDLPARFEI
jgi:CheY-like chemotaxis protein